MNTTISPSTVKENTVKIQNEFSSAFREIGKDSLKNEIMIAKSILLAFLAVGSLVLYMVENGDNIVKKQNSTNTETITPAKSTSEPQ